MAKTNVVPMTKPSSDEITLDDLMRRTWDAATAVLDGTLSPVKADKVIRASAVMAKEIEIRCKYGEQAKVVLAKK